MSPISKHGESKVGSRKHIATHGTIGWAGHRVGTRYLYTFEEARAAAMKGWFRFRNAKCAQKYHEWLAQQDTRP